jgi:hypothetical protein
MSVIVVASKTCPTLDPESWAAAVVLSNPRPVVTPPILAATVKVFPDLENTKTFSSSAAPRSTTITNGNELPSGNPDPLATLNDATEELIPAESVVSDAAPTNSRLFRVIIHPDQSSEISKSPVEILNVSPASTDLVELSAPWNNKFPAER